MYFCPTQKILPMDNLLENKNAFITGASRGIGKQIALAFAKQGANVIFTATHPGEHIDALLKELDKYGHKNAFYAYDAASFEETKNAVDNAIREFNTIDILVNNAGITRDNLMLRMQEKNWDDVINTNLKSVFNHVKTVQSYMLKQRSGSIINMSSIVGITGNAGQCNYAASKAAVIGFTKSLARELGSRNIRCNAIAPGFIETDMTHNLPQEVKEGMLKSIPLRRIGQTDDIANLALFLASDMSAYITGQVIRCDGGM